MAFAGTWPYFTNTWQLVQNLRLHHHRSAAARNALWRHQKYLQQIVILSNNASVLFQHIRASETHSVQPTVETKLARPQCFHTWSELLLWDSLLSSLLLMCH